MFSMVLMAALTTGTDLPDLGRHGGGCCGGGGCYGGMAYGGYGMGCYGGSGRGCYGGSGRGWGGCYGGGARMGWGGGYGGYSGFAWGGTSPIIANYAYWPMISPFGGAAVASGAMLNPSVTQSFYYSGGVGRPANEATIIVHLPQDASLTIDGQPTQSRSNTRVFQSPPLEPGKTYVYTLHGEINRDGRFITAYKTVEIRAGQPTEVTLNFDNRNRPAEQINQPARTPANSAPARPSFPTPPPERE